MDLHQRVTAREVLPFKNKKDIEKLKKYFRLEDNLRNYCIFVMGINVCLRAGDLLSLRVKDVATISGRRITIEDKVYIKEEKTGKNKDFSLNKSAKEALKEYLSTIKNLKEDDFLFKSRKGDSYLTVKSLHKIIKTATRILKIKGNYGTHSLRKTCAFYIYMQNIEDNPRTVPLLQKMLNHSSWQITLRYIGIESEEIDSLYLDLNL